jgi:CrcB protein
MIPDWQHLGMVATGGACGAVSRYLVTVVAGEVCGEKFPYGTLLVNVAGCLAIGCLLRLGSGWVSEPLRLLIAVGFLGGLTTFSTFGMDTVSRLQQGEWGLALINVGSNVGLGLGAVALGIVIGSWIAGEDASDLGHSNETAAEQTVEK